MEANLGTTNLLLGIMAGVSVLEALVIIGMGVAGFVIFRRVSDLLGTLESRHVAPAMFRVNAILDDVKDVTARVKEETERVDNAIRNTMDRVDDTAGFVSRFRHAAGWLIEDHIEHDPAFACCRRVRLVLGGTERIAHSRTQLTAQFSSRLQGAIPMVGCKS